MLKQNIEKNSEDIINKEQKFNEKSRFCNLQSSSSSSSEKDMAFGQKKKYMMRSVDHDVPEEATQEDQKSCGNDDIEIEAIQIPQRDNAPQASEETSGNNHEFENSLFTFNFLNEENPRPFAGIQNPQQNNFMQPRMPPQPRDVGHGSSMSYRTGDHRAEMDEISTQNTSSYHVPTLEVNNRS